MENKDTLEESIRALELDEYFTEFGYLNTLGYRFLDQGVALSFLLELKEARRKLKTIKDIAREAFNKPDTLNIDLYRSQALANIYAIFEYNGATLKEDPPEDDNQVTIEEVLDNE